jgi:hypothetical protein
MALFDGNHLADLADIFVKACLLDEHMLTAAPNTVIGTVYGEEAVTTSEGVVVVHTAFVTPERGIMHRVTLASERVNADDLTALARFLQEALNVGGTIDTKSAPARASFTLTAPNVERARAFQKTLEELSDSEELWRAIAKYDVSSAT